MPNDTTPPEPEDLIRYDVLAQEALRSVVRKVLTEVARTGLPGDHHFYITFDTTAPGVRISSRMKERYPEEMTVVVQHQYWDLETTDTGFSIGLSFDNIPENLLIPYAAIRGFFDPSVQFGLQFDNPNGDENEVAGEPDAEPAQGGSVAILSTEPTIQTGEKTDEKTGEKTDLNTAASDPEDDSSASAEVVSLDAFRKK